MNIFSWVLIPVVFYLFFLRRSDFRDSALFYALIAGLITATVIYIVGFFISWGSIRSVLPTFWKLFFYALKRETVVPLIIALLGFWLFRGSLWEKNNDYSFSANFIFFGVIFFIIGCGENLYNRYDSDIYQIICAPLFRLSIVFVASYLLAIAESLSLRAVSLLLVFCLLIYGSLCSLGYAFFYSRNSLWLLLILGFAFIIPLSLFLFLPKQYGAKGLISR